MAKIFVYIYIYIYIYRNMNIINLWTSGGMFKIQEIDVDTCGSSLIWIWTMRVKNWCPNNLGGEFHWWFKHNGISIHPLTHLFSVRISMNKQTNLRSSKLIFWHHQKKFRCSWGDEEKSVFGIEEKVFYNHLCTESKRLSHEGYWRAK